MSDKARECAEEFMRYVGSQGQKITLVQSEIEQLIHKHFPPAVPVEKLLEIKRRICFTNNPEGHSGFQYVKWDDIVALIAEAERGERK